MAEIHSSAIVKGEVELADDVDVGPWCVLDGTLGAVRIGAGTKLIGNVYVTGPATLGVKNTVYPFACIGFAPQDLKFDPKHAGPGLMIGDENVFREYVSLHRATGKELPTRIGSKNYFMANSHVGHDCIVGNNVIAANGAALGGFARVDDKVILGGTAMVHQFVRIGRGAMMSGTVGATQDVPPFFMVTMTNLAASMNIIGMRRAGMSRGDIDTVKWVYKTLYRSGVSPKQVVRMLKERADDPLVREYIEFVETSPRGICPGRLRVGRGGTKQSRTEAGSEDVSMLEA